MHYCWHTYSVTHIHAQDFAAVLYFVVKIIVADLNQVVRLLQNAMFTKYYLIQ